MRARTSASDPLHTDVNLIRSYPRQAIKANGERTTLHHHNVLSPPLTPATAPLLLSGDPVPRAYSRARGRRPRRRPPPVRRSPQPQPTKKPQPSPVPLQTDTRTRHATAHRVAKGSTTPPERQRSTVAASRACPCHERVNANRSEGNPAKANHRKPREGRGRGG